MSRATVDFTKILRRTDPTFAGVGCSTFGHLASESAQGAAEKALDARYFRIPVRWNGSNIVSSASGNNNRPVEDALKVYYSWSGVRMLLVIAGRDGDWANYQNGDAGNIVKRLVALGMSDLTRFDFSGSNEPDLNGAGGMSNVANRCIQIAGELSAAGAAGRVWGPVWSNPGGDFRGFATQVGASRLAGIDWHSYPGGGGTYERSVGQVLDDAANHDNVVAGVRSMLESLGMSAQMNIDEFNWSWQHGQAPPLYTAANTVLLALGYCKILSAGGRAMSYATQNGDLSVLADDSRPGGRADSTPMPAYWGIAALTGAGMPGQPRLFPHYKDTFFSVSGQDDSAVWTFALNNEAGGFNIIVINRSETDSKTHIVTLGQKGTYDAFQTVANAPYDAPRKIVAAQTFDTSMQVTLPAMTVTVLVLSGAGAATPPATPPATTTAITEAISGTATLPPTGWAAKNASVVGGVVGSNPGTVTNVPNGVPSSLFDSERYGDQTWTISGIPAVAATLEMFFAEKYSGVTAAGQRVMRVEVNGVVISKTLDVFQQAGGSMKVLRVACEVAGVTTITVRLIGVTGSAFINALRVVSL